MRLTLRTLLAYLDRVLDPKDTELLREKIAQGRVARGMVDRIQSVLARPKLAAPKVDARGPHGDANVIAEYLDNTLDEKSVVEFEQACLGEDARLAEVAGCHQILTMTLSKPANVSEELRMRIRQLGNSSTIATEPAKVDDASISSQPVRSNVVIDDRNGKRFRIDASHSTSEPIRDDIRPENSRPISSAGLELDEQLISQVPEYLRSGTSSEWSNALILVGLIAALLVVAWLSLGSIDEVKNLLHQRTTVVEQSPSSNKVPSAEVGAIRGDRRDIVEPTAIEESMSAPPAANVPSIHSNSPSIIETENAAPPIPNIEAGENGSSPIDSSQVDIDPTKNVPTHIDSPPIATDIRPAHEKVASGPVAWQPESKTSASVPVFAIATTENGPSGIRRLAIGDAIAVNERWIVPAACRTEFKLAPGVRWIVADETSLSSASNESEGLAAVSLQLGRAMVHPTPDCQRLLLKTSLPSIQLAWKEASSIAAIELRYKRIVGATIEESIKSTDEVPVPYMSPVLSIVCVAGETNFSLEKEEPIALGVGQGVLLSLDSPPRRINVKEIPWWYRSSIQRPIDASATEELIRRFSDESKAEPIHKRLEAMLDNRRSEAAALAMRTLFLSGSYPKCFGTDGMLSNTIFRPHRAILIESLYQSIGSDANNLSILKETIEADDPPRAARLLTLMSLPDDEQLANGADRGLVESLSSPFFDERVLGIFQLSAIVGKEHGYQSDRPSAESLQQWKRLLNSGRIRWSKPTRE